MLPLVFTLLAVDVSSRLYIISKSGKGIEKVASSDPKRLSKSASNTQSRSTNSVLDVVQSIFLGLPSQTSMVSNFISIGINAIFAAMVADYVFRARFLHPGQDLSMARIGFVSETSASLLVREPHVARTPVIVRYVQSECSDLSTGAIPSSANASWMRAGSIDSLNGQTDFTGSLIIANLKPDTVYDWATSNNHSGRFVTAPRKGDLPARTGADDGYTFLHSSCLKNNFPYNPFFHSLSNQGLKHLGRVLGDVKAQFMIFLGDFIYADVPRRHGTSVEDFRREYRQIYASPDWRGASQSLPWIHVYDDHEIANDWSANTTGIFSSAVDPYDHYHVSVNPPRVRPSETYFAFAQGPASFFLLDTRRYRSPNDGTDGRFAAGDVRRKTMLGDQQLADLLAWLRAPEAPGVRWKIVVSSVPFTRNWQFSAQDTWRGYLGERQVILEAMWAAGAEDGMGVIVLSGDRHEFAATAFPPHPAAAAAADDESDGGAMTSEPTPIGEGDPGTILTQPDEVKQRGSWPASATVYEFSASPLSMFYLPLRTYRESSIAADYTSDVCIKYIPNGNSKFGAVSITRRPFSDESILHYRLFVDGTERWNYTVTAPPSPPSRTATAGAKTGFGG